MSRFPGPVASGIRVAEYLTELPPREVPVLAYYQHFPCELFCVIQVFLVGMASVH